MIRPGNSARSARLRASRLAAPLFALASMVATASPATASAIPAAPFFKPGNDPVVIRLDSQDELVFEEKDNDQYALNGRKLIVVVQNLSFRGRVAVGGFTEPVAEPGEPGLRGPMIYVEVRRAVSPRGSGAQLKIDASGQAGGDAPTAGGNGGDGGAVVLLMRKVYGSRADVSAMAAAGKGGRAARGGTPGANGKPGTVIDSDQDPP